MYFFYGAWRVKYRKIRHGTQKFYLARFKMITLMLSRVNEAKGWSNKNALNEKGAGTMSRCRTIAAFSQNTRFPLPARGKKLSSTL